MKPYINIQTTSGITTIFIAHIVYMIKDKDSTVIHLNTGKEPTTLTVNIKMEDVLKMINGEAV